MSKDSNIDEIDNYRELIEFAIDEFIKKYDNDYRIKSYKIRDALDAVHFMKYCKFLVLHIDYETSDNSYNIYETNADDSLTVNRYTVMNNINYVEELDESLITRCGYNKESFKTFVSNGVIYLNLNALIRKYKIRNLV